MRSLFVTCTWNSTNNLPSLRALDNDLQGLFATWLSPACLELHRITWNDPACLLEKIVTYEVCTYALSLLYGCEIQRSFKVVSGQH